MPSLCKGPFSLGVPRSWQTKSPCCLGTARGWGTGARTGRNPCGLRTDAHMTGRTLARRGARQRVWESETHRHKQCLHPQMPPETGAFQTTALGPPGGETVCKPVHVALTLLIYPSLLP